MKEEEIDWLIYHQIAGCDAITIDELARKNGLPADVVGSSVGRLQRHLLIEFRGGDLHALSVNESLIRCQIRYDASLPYSIENGVIKEKKRGGP